MVLEPDNFVLDWTLTCLLFFFDRYYRLHNKGMNVSNMVICNSEKENVNVITKDLQQHCNIVVCTQFVADQFQLNNF